MVAGFEALPSAARVSANPNDLGEEHGHRALRVVGKGTRIVLLPLPPAVGRAIDRRVPTGPSMLLSVVHRLAET